jgi:methyl-accepting chemotaxis protein
MVFRRKKEEQQPETELLTDEEYDAEAELQKQLEAEREYERRLLEREKAEVKREEEEVTVESLLMKIEKLEGKLTSFEEARGRIDDRMMRISEQVGELRTMILEREKSFGFLESDVEKIKDVFEEIKPSEFSKELDKKERKIAKNEMKIEKLENLVEKLSEEVSGFRRLLDKIKSIENLIDVSKEISEKISGIDETKKYTDRLAAKTETIFSELSKHLAELEDYKSKVERVDEIIKELMRSVDEISVKLDNTVEKKELKDETKRLEDRLVEKFMTSKDVEEKLEIMDEIVDSVEKRVRLIELDKASLEIGGKIKELSPGSKEMRRIERLTREWKDIVELMKTIEDDYKRGEISKESFDEFKRKNRNKLDEIRKMIKEDVIRLKESLEMEIGPISLKTERVKAPRKEEPPKVEPKVEAPAETKPEPPRVEIKTEPPRIETKKRPPEKEIVKEPVEAGVQRLGESSLHEIEEEIKLRETEKGVILNLMNGLSSEMNEAKRAAMEMGYKKRLEKITSEIDELMRLKEAAS